MKKHLKIFCSLIVFGLFVVSTTMAQDFPDVTMSSDEGLVLPSDSPVVEKYEIDFSNFNWTPENAQQGATYLDSKSDLISIEVDYPNQKLVVTLDLNSPVVYFWTKKQWDLHLANVR